MLYITSYYIFYLIYKPKTLFDKFIYLYFTSSNPLINQLNGLYFVIAKPVYVYQIRKPILKCILTLTCMSCKNSFRCILLKSKPINFQVLIIAQLWFLVNQSVTIVYKF